MSITGSLADFPLPEILQFIEKGKKTGLLTIVANPVCKATPLSVQYIWVHQGRLVAAADRLDERGLVQLINQCQGVSDRVVTKLAQLCPPDKPLGLHLVNQRVLQTSQLKQLFFTQVLQTLYALVQLKEGQFKFEQNAPLPMREMTGLRVAAGIPTFFAPLRDTKTVQPDSPQPNISQKRSRLKDRLSKELAPVFA